jgi:predicted MFS family arabinose efflux permease
MGPLLTKLAGAGPDAVGLGFAIYGVFGFIGLVISTRVVDGWGAYKTSVLFTLCLFAGVAGWAITAGSFALMAASVAVWGLGFASTNSMQQVRLVAAAPDYAGASVSLNTSVLYVGQAVGSAIGGALFASGQFVAAGYVAAGFVALALGAVFITGRPFVAKPALQVESP